MDDQLNGLNSLAVLMLELWLGALGVGFLFRVAIGWFRSLTGLRGDDL